MSKLLNIIRFLKKNATWIKWLIAILIMSFLVYNNWDGLRKLPERTIQWHYLVLAFALCSFAILLTFYRWYLLVWAQDLPFRIRDAVRIGFIGYLLNYVSPGAVGGDFIKAAMIAKEQKERRGAAAATVFVDRILGLLGLLIVGSIVCLIPTDIMEIKIFQKVKGAYMVGALIGLGGIILMMIPTVPRWRLVQMLTHIPFVGKIIGGIINAIIMYQARWRVIVVVIIASVFGHMIMLTSFYFCSIALNDANNTPGYVEHLQFIPAAELAGVIIPLPGGTGALEGAIEYCYKEAGANKEDGFITGVAYRLLSILTAFIGAGYYLVSRKEIQKAMHSEEDSASP